MLYIKGWGVTKDYRQAAQWFAAAGDRDPDAQNNLGYLYTKGLGVPKDAEKAFQLFQRAANGGSADAKEALGEMYYNGTAKAKDFDEARKWSHRAKLRDQPRRNLSASTARLCEKMRKSQIMALPLCAEGCCAEK